MRKLIYHIACSVDGFIADENSSVSAFLMEGDHVQDFKKSMNNYDTVIMGRKTYEFGFQFGLKAGEPAYKGLKHIIFSSSLTFETNNDVILMNSCEIDFIKNLKEKEGKSIWLCGGARLAAFLYNSGLIDEIILKVNPFALGKGLALFENLNNLSKLNLHSSKQYGNGVVLLHYNVIF